MITRHIAALRNSICFPALMAAAPHRYGLAEMAVHRWLCAELARARTAQAETKAA